MFYYTTYRKDHSMISIEMPHKLYLHLRRSYFRDTTGVIGFETYVRHNIPKAIVEGPLSSGYMLHFHEEADYFLFKLKWSEYVS